ncbi:hypothetical protein PCANC_09098 [Puccinia coronata f. sp. avenae]|uniref:Uncharacterized protein n=1 Tax=Puccinia coronata f. sp. avenae TaxID=200324 RepID=A0A2N5SWY9_9BASI|nr:hypothetical protein PCANC_09098 [Puccinia coronata f. sp. avenae]PLW51437.1 hypothetical protein PCASD_00360 [Puccinia coronata f. sp. avenae]
MSGTLTGHSAAREQRGTPGQPVVRAAALRRQLARQLRRDQQFRIRDTREFEAMDDGDSQSFLKFHKSAFREAFLNGVNIGNLSVIEKAS